MEIFEDDCGCHRGLEIQVLSKNHLNSLIGKYWAEVDIDNVSEWKLITKNDLDLIGKKIQIRSPMTCQTQNFKICKKCFGEKKIRTKYIGATAGQCITERLTQLLLRSFHTSGSCELTLDNNVLEFLKNHLIDIQEKDNIISLFADCDFPSNGFQNIPGYLNHSEKIIQYQQISEDIHNNDALYIVEKLKEILKKNDKVTKKPGEYYTDLTECILSVGEIFSSYIEMVLAHMFMVSESDFWRYNQTQKIVTKLSDKTMAAKISPLLGFLYQPNRISINGITDDHLLNSIVSDEAVSFHEKIFLQKF